MTARVRVKFANRRQLRQAFLRDLTQGTLFVRTDTPLELGEATRLVLELPDGAQVEVSGQVVQVVPPHAASRAAPPGVRVRLADFTADKRAQIEELLARSRTLRPVAGSGVPAMELLVRGLRRLVWLCGDAVALGEVDYYQILGLPATATTAEIREACTVLRVLLDPAQPPDGLIDRLTEAQRTRVAALHETVLEIERTLTDEARRARYDAEVFSIVR